MDALVMCEIWSADGMLVAGCGEKVVPPTGLYTLQVGQLGGRRRREARAAHRLALKPATHRSYPAYWTLSLPNSSQVA